LKLEEPKKELCIKEVVEGAKCVLRITGKHKPQLIGLGKEGLVLAILLFETDREKDMAVEEVRRLVKLHEIRKYWIVMEAWKTELKPGEKMFRRAKQDIDRKEVLIINEFTSDLKNICVCIPFRWEGEELIFDKEAISTESHSIWNVYLERQGIDERFEKDVKEINDAFLKKLAHNVSEKYEKEFFEAKTPEEMMAVLKKVISDGAKAISDQKKTILEDPDKDDINDEGLQD